MRPPPNSMGPGMPGMNMLVDIFKRVFVETWAEPVCGCMWNQKMTDWSIPAAFAFVFFSGCSF